MTTLATLFPASLERCHAGYRHPFLYGLGFSGGVGDVPRTLADLAMSQFSAELRRERGWRVLHHDRNVQKRWAADAALRSWRVKTPSGVMDVDLSPKQIQYVIDELEGYERLYDRNNECGVSCFERIWESAAILDARLLEKFLNHLDNLRNRNLLTCRHGGSYNSPELFFIDQLLYSAVYGTTLFVHPINGLRQPLPPPVSEDAYTISARFAMLPSDVQVSLDGTAMFTSYINNLPREDTLDFYRDLETLLTRTIPLFEHTLTDLHRNNPISPRIKGTSRYTVWDEPDAPEYSDDEEGWIVYERNMRDWVLNRPIQLPEVPGGYPGWLEYRRQRVSLRDRKIQIIPRLIRIELREEPSYTSKHSGFDWRVEGMRNERVVACAMHLLSCKNLEPLSIDFRMAVAHPKGFAAGDEGATTRTWGLKNRDPCHQYIGSVPLHERLSITFPNIYQYRISALSLEDKSRPGSLTLLTFLLVDPDIQPIISTANVPPQQPSWIKPVVYEVLCKRLPLELVETIWDMCDWFITSDNAEDLRSDYMDTLAEFTKKNNLSYFCLPFDAWAQP